MTNSIRARFAMTAVAFLASSRLAGAAQLCVDSAGTPGCFATIQAAFDVAAPGDEIEIAAGVYPENLVLSTDDLSIRGAGVDQTRLDPGSLSLGGSRVSVSDLAILNGDHGVLVTGQRCLLERVLIAGMPFHPGLVINGYSAQVVDSTLAENGLQGVGGVDTTGGIVVNGGLHLIRSTVTGNRGHGVLGQTFSKSLRIESSTISANSEAGIRPLGASVRILRSTIVENRTGIVLTHRPATLRSTILYGNAEGDCEVGSFGRLRSQGYNLIGDASCDPNAAPTIRLKPSDLTGVDPMLGPLADNGGPTETHALLPGSPAAEHVTSGPGCRREDQRGVPRSAPCDAGAYEAP
jgi:hypothetical protein